MAPEVPATQTQAAGSAIGKREIPASKYCTSLMLDGFGPRVHEHLTKLQDKLSKYDLNPEETLKTESPLNCLVFYSSAIIDHIQKERSLS